MTEKEFSNLFDLASKKKKKEAEPEGKKGPSTPVGTSYEEFKIGDDMNAAFERYKKMHDEIKTTLEDAYEKAKVSPKQIADFFSEPRHFDAAQWRAVQVTKKEVAQKIGELLPKKSEEESPEKEEKVKKTKSGLISKKRWLSMH